MQSFQVIERDLIGSPAAIVLFVQKLLAHFPESLLLERHATAL
jgi:hypothetical protein